MPSFVPKIAASLCVILLPCSGLAETYVVTGSVNLRTGPGIGYARMATLPQGAMVHVHSCIPTISWCNVSYEHLSGWASGRYMAPTIAVAPYVGAYSGVGTQFQTVHPSGGVVVAGSVPVFHAPVQQPPVIVYDHSSSYPGRVVRYQQVISTQPIIPYSWPHPYFVGQVGTMQVDMR